MAVPFTHHKGSLEVPIHQEATGRYRIDVQLKGQRARLRCDTKEEAEAIEAKLLLILKEGRTGPQAIALCLQQNIGSAPSGRIIPRTVGELVEFTYRRHWSNLKISDTPHAQAKAISDIVGPNKKLSSISIETVDLIIDELRVKGIASATINRYLSAWSTMMRLAEDRGYIIKRPKIQYNQEDEGRIRWLTFDEEREVLRLIRSYGANHVADFVEIAMDTGFRRAELLGFHLKDYDGKRLYLWGNDGKGRRTKAGNNRSVAATPRVRSVISRRIADGFNGHLFKGLGDYSIRYYWDRARATMGLTDDTGFVLHACRHTCATRLIQANVNIRVVQQWMGHKAIQTTLRYAHVNDALIDDAGERLSALLDG